MRKPWTHPSYSGFCLDGKEILPTICFRFLTRRHEKTRRAFSRVLVMVLFCDICQFRLQTTAMRRPESGSAENF